MANRCRGKPRKSVQEKECESYGLMEWRMDMDGAEQRFPRATTLGGPLLWGSTQLESSKAYEKAPFKFRVALGIYKHIF